MSAAPAQYPSYPAGPGGKPARPVPVTVAALLMLLGAALGLAVGIAMVAAAAGIARDFRSGAQSSGASQSDIDALTDGVRAGFIGVGIAIGVLALIIAALALGVLRGSNAARISTLVVIFLSLCCGIGTSVSTLGTGAGRNTLRYGDVDEETGRALGDALNDAVPTWLAALGGGLPCLQLLGYVAVAVLLLLPASNAYFRRPQRQVGPPDAQAPDVFPPTAPPPPPPGPPPPSPPPPGSGPPAADPSG